MSAHQSEPWTPRSSDRLLTPTVIVFALVVGGGLVALTIVSVAWLTVQGLDPDPMLRLVTEVTGAVALLLNLLLTIGSRSGVAKVERTTGRDLPQKVDELGKKLDEALYLEAQPETTRHLPPVPPLARTEPHPFADRPQT